MSGLILKLGEEDLWDPQEMSCGIGVRVSGLALKSGGEDLWDPQETMLSEQWKAATIVLFRSLGKTVGLGLEEQER